MSPRSMCPRTASTPASYAARSSPERKASGVGGAPARLAAIPTGRSAPRRLSRAWTSSSRRASRRASPSRARPPSQAKPGPAVEGDDPVVQGEAQRRQVLVGERRWPGAARARRRGRSRGSRPARPGIAARRPGRPPSRPAGRRGSGRPRTDRGPAAGDSSTAIGSAVRYVQRALRPGRALSNRARPGRSRNASAMSIGRARRDRSGSRRSRTGTCSLLDRTSGSPLDDTAASSRCAAGAGRPLASADAFARPRPHHRARAARTAQRHHRRARCPSRPHDAHLGRRAAGRRARARSGPVSPVVSPRGPTPGVNPSSPAATA